LKRKLRTGFTTGTAAAAATKGALRYLLEGNIPSRVMIELLTGDKIAIPIHRCERIAEEQAKCTVIKDAGDDPDVTHKAEIGAEVKLLKPDSKYHNNIYISGGAGVGKITKPGLEMPPGEPAINPGPRKMINQAITETLAQHDLQRAVTVEVFVPRGAEIAKKTLNARLGILGGISILGTTGLVRPMSHDAFIATIKSGLSVARASGNSKVVLTTGRRSERYAQQRWPLLAEEAFIQIGDFFPHTHAAKSRLTLDQLSGWARQITRNLKLSQKILSANTARHAFDIISPDHPELIAHVGKQVIKSAKMFAGKKSRIHCVIFDYEGQAVYDSAKERTFS
jgi:cobalt-precorrin-5B (C1)-methyltransferase